MRTAFMQQLIREAEKNDRIFLVVGDLGFSVVEPFAEKFPNRYLNVGIAEQNMTGIAAGLSMEGYTVFTYSIGNFPTLRCLEQIRYDVCYHNQNVKIVAVGGGFAYGPLGVSHHATEDIGIMRSLPNMVVCAPGDPVEARDVAAEAASKSGPYYIRLGKAGEPHVHQTSRVIEWGKFVEVLSGSHTAVLTTGGVLKYAADFLAAHKPHWGLYSVPYVKPIDMEGLHALSHRYEVLITIEEHQRSGGFGSAILEGLHDIDEKGKLLRWPKIYRKAIPDVFLRVAGQQDYLRSISGVFLDPDDSR